MDIDHVVLLRGINVGGRNTIRMPELVAACEAAGFEDVATYIQSGNVLLRADVADRAELAGRIEALLGERFGLAGPVAIRDRDELRLVVESAPDGFGADPERYRYDVIFLMPPLTAAVALEVVEPREGVDEVAAGPDVLYFRRLIARAAQSRLSRIVARPEYARMTIRNWRTTTTLLARMDARSS